MKVTDLTEKNKPIELRFILMEDFKLSHDVHVKNAIECVLVDRDVLYVHNEDKYVLDVMYFKFKNSENNCIVFGKFNSGVL